MARIARIVVPGAPHHVTQRGNRSSQVFFSDADYAFYCQVLAEQCRRYGVELWAWCLMPNHVHLIAVPETETSLARAIGETHRRYASFVNSRANETGHLFQNRFASVVMDEEHLATALRYVSLNPVRAKLVRRARDWKWSSVRAHVEGRDDGLTEPKPALERFPDFAALIAAGPDEASFAALRAAEKTGRPLAGKAFAKRLEKQLGRPVMPQRRGPKPRA